MEKPRGKKIQEEQTRENLERVRHYYEKGYSQSQIARFMGFKSKTAIVYYIKKIRESET